MINKHAVFSLLILLLPTLWAQNTEVDAPFENDPPEDDSQPPRAVSFSVYLTNLELSDVVARLTLIITELAKDLVAPPKCSGICKADGQLTTGWVIGDCYDCGGSQVTNRLVGVLQTVSGWRVILDGNTTTADGSFVANLATVIPDNFVGMTTEFVSDPVTPMPTLPVASDSDDKSMTPVIVIVVIAVVIICSLALISYVRCYRRRHLESDFENSPDAMSEPDITAQPDNNNNLSV